MRERGVMSRVDAVAAAEAAAAVLARDPRLEQVMHGYLRIDPARVEAALHRAPTDIRVFARAVPRWLASIELAAT